MTFSSRCQLFRSSLRSSPLRSSISPDVNPLRGAPMTRSAAPWNLDIPVRWCQWAGSGVNSLWKPTQAQGETRCRPMLSDRIRASLACLPLPLDTCPDVGIGMDGGTIIRGKIHSWTTTSPQQQTHPPYLRSELSTVVFHMEDMMIITKILNNKSEAGREAGGPSLIPWPARAAHYI